MYAPGEIRELLYQNVCNGNIKGKSEMISNVNASKKIHRAPKCHLVQYGNPFLFLGPFHFEVIFYHPLRTLIHDFFTEEEMDWMMEYSKPQLTSMRSKDVLMKQKYKYIGSQASKIIEKAVTVWFDDIQYTNHEVWHRIGNKNYPPEYTIEPVAKDPYDYRIQHFPLLKISRKIEFATNLNVTERYGSSSYQTTNYGLSGMVATHLDPWGFESGVKMLSHEKKKLLRTGDYIATFMGWLENTIAGGSTAFLKKNYEGVLRPKRGSAAFWINLFSCHKMDERSVHSGCPVLKGSKWILNKWIYSWDQWKKLPCFLQEWYDVSPLKVPRDCI